MKENTIITIGRQFGSGGREIGRKIADLLGIPFYDKELIVAAAKKSGLSETVFESADEQAANSLLYSLVMGAYASTKAIAGMPPISMNETIFQIQSDVISEMAEKGSCVIVGRCADYILREKNCLNLFIHDPMDKRIERIRTVCEAEKEKAEEIITKTDKKRANFYNYYTGQRWGEAKNYHLSIDSSVLGTDGSAKMVCSFLENL